MSKASVKPGSQCPGVCPGASRQFASVRPGQTGMNLETVHIFPVVLRTIPGLGQKLIMVCPGNATMHSRVAPEVRPDAQRFCCGNLRQSPGVTPAGHGSRTAKPRCFMVANEYQCFL